MKKILVVAAVMLALSVSAVQAREATLTVEPVNSGTIIISGDGFHPNEDLEIGVLGLGPSVFLSADKDGAFSTEYSPGGGFSGDTATAVAIADKAHFTIRAETTFTVVE